MQSFEQHLESPPNTDPADMGGLGGMSGAGTDADIDEGGMGAAGRGGTDVAGIGNTGGAGQTGATGGQAPNMVGDHPADSTGGNAAADAAPTSVTQGDVGDVNDPDRSEGNAFNGGTDERWSRPSDIDIDTGGPHHR